MGSGWSRPLFLQRLAATFHYKFWIHLSSSLLLQIFLYTFNKIFSLSSVFKSPWNIPYWAWTDLASATLLSAFPPCAVWRAWRL